MRYLFVLLTIVSFAYACSSSSGNNEKKDSAKVCKNDVNPNGSSELALLMREMAAWTDSCNVSVGQYRPAPPMPRALTRIHELKKTDPSIDKELFDNFADVYLKRVDEFVVTDPKLDVRAVRYNEMVKACISCHENFCHGPIKRIRKMLRLIL